MNKSYIIISLNLKKHIGLESYFSEVVLQLIWNHITAKSLLKLKLKLVYFPHLYYVILYTNKSVTYYNVVKNHSN